MIIRTFLLVSSCMFILLDAVDTKPQDIQNDKQQGPCVGMDCLHGVLMHNDEAQGGEHKTEDQYLRFKSALDTDNPRAGPQDAEAQLHGVLMHGDSKTGEHHEENKDILPEQVSETGPKDLSQIIHEGMHGDEGTHVKHDWEKDQQTVDNVRRGPLGDKFMHGVLMHGDENHAHTEENEGDTEVTKESNQKVGPQDAAEYLHGILMHGDSEPGKEHNHKGSTETTKGGNTIGPNNDLHGILMHGDTGSGHDHSNEDANKEHEVFSDMSKIMDLGLDEDLLKIIDLKKILERDRQEYADWIINNPQYQDESMMGSTWAGVSDTILDDIERMKKRYLAKNNQDTGSDADNKFLEDENPFTAEDARAAYEESARAEEGEDMRHDLELLGSTEPLNARHKAKLALLKSKSKE